MVKKVGYCIYAHVTNIQELIQELKESEQVDWLLSVISLNYSNCISTLNRHKNEVPCTLKPVIIKYNKKNNSVSLIECEDWNTANEPTVGDSYCFSISGSIRVIKGGSKVYHNKWQFVSDDYKGFDIKQAKLRTESWNRIEGIEDLKFRIGSKKFWYSLLEQHNLPI